VPQPISRRIPTGQDEATSQYWNLKIPLEKNESHHSVDICGQNELKLTCEQTVDSNNCPGYTPGPPLKGEDRGQEGGEGREGERRRGERSQGRGRRQGRGGWENERAGKGDDAYSFLGGWTPLPRAISKKYNYSQMLI
jgi:hypothetical protein